MKKGGKKNNLMVLFVISCQLFFFIVLPHKTSNVSKDFEGEQATETQLVNSQTWNKEQTTK